ncbi:MAG: exonuclease VII large subunit [Rhodopseudomonas sp.]|nr:exonuclease VII large subunit [Rhodopseudomonas sp.]
MKKLFGMLSVATILLAAVPLTSYAETPQEAAAKAAAAAKKKAAPAAKPAPPARPAPVARPAAPPRPAPVARPAPAARPAPHPQAARPVPHRQPPAAARVAPQHRPAPTVRHATQPQPRVNRAERRAPTPRTVTPKTSTAAKPTASPQRAATPSAVSPAQARRQERLQRAREDRALRRLPPRQRAARRREIERDRQQRAVQRANSAPSAAARSSQTSPIAAATTAARTGNRATAARLNRGPRRNGQARVSAQAARQGRFAAPFAATGTASTTARAAHVAPRRAWRSGHRANFVAWFGPVFYPYAYSDIFDYAFWPDGYDDDYWYAAYDDMFDGVFFGEVGQPEEYVGSIPRDATDAPTYKAVSSLCRQPGDGITAWPISEIENKVGLNRDQIALLDGVKRAGSKAASVFRATCPLENAFPLTPTGRLAGMTARLNATLEAVQTVRPELEKFYDSLSDEQKERFNRIGPSKAITNPEARAALPDDARKCGEAKPGLTNLPIEQIDDALHPNKRQEGELDNLANATVKAVGILQAACPSETPLTPPGRMQAIETRLKAMIEAADTVKPALDSFYGSLNAEQKARFNRLGRELAQSADAQ